MESREFQIAVRRPVETPRMQLGCVATTTEEGRRGFDDGNKWELLVHGHGRTLKRSESGPEL